MKVCLAFMMQNDFHWLGLHLPLYRACRAFDGVVAIDGGSSDDSVAYVESLGGKVFHHPFDWKFGEQAQRLVEHCRDEGYDAMLRVDPDEAMLLDDMYAVKFALQMYPDRLLGLARRNFVGDRLHVHPDWYPDYQWRAWWLNTDTHYDPTALVHELPTGNRLELSDVTLFHYGYTEPQPERAYRIAMYDAIQNGKPLPVKAEYANWTLDIPRVPFTGAQPLDPNVIGIHAPFESVLS